MLTPRQLFLNHIAQTSDAPMMLDIVKAKGSTLTDRDGREYIDLIAGIGVSNTGHGHPEVLKAVESQARSYMHLMVYGEFVETPQVKFAQALSERLPPALGHCYFVNSGAEAVEGALKAAKRHTGRHEIVAFDKAYHGSTHGALSLMGDARHRDAFRPLLPGIRLLDFNDRAALAQITEKTACVVHEVIQAEAGVVLPENQFLQALAARCRETGALLISDEIQTGGGRTGTLFAFEQYNMTPDILLLAKSLGGGMPLGAFISSGEIMGTLAHDPPLGHMTTFGGHPVSCAAGLAALQVVTGMDLAGDMARKEALFREHLSHPAIRSVEGRGLMLAVAFDDEATCRKVIRHCVANGVVTDWFLFAGHKMRIAPPLVISDEVITESCRRIVKSIEQAVHESEPKTETGS